jgi:hypothetical protein
MAREEDERIAAEQAATGKHPAEPQRDSEDFAEGQEQLPHPEEPEPNFARGQADEALPEEQRHGSFDDGQADLPENAEHQIERRFSEGQEISPDSE